MGWGSDRVLSPKWEVLLLNDKIISLILSPAHYSRGYFLLSTEKALISTSRK